MAPSSAGKGWGSTKIERVGNPGRLVVPRSAQWQRVVPGRGGADIGVPLNYSSTIESSAGEGWGDIGVPLNYSSTIEIPLKYN